MPYQYKREPLTQDGAKRLANACKIGEEKLIAWILLGAGLCVSELTQLTKANLDWQGHRLMVYSKSEPYGSFSRRRMIPLLPRIRPLIEGHFAVHEKLGMSPRTIQRLVKCVANRDHASRPVTPHVLRRTFSTTAAQKGISLPTLQRLFGHDRDIPSSFTGGHDP